MSCKAAVIREGVPVAMEGAKERSSSVESQCPINVTRRLKSYAALPPQRNATPGCCHILSQVGVAAQVSRVCGE